MNNIMKKLCINDIKKNFNNASSVYGKHCQLQIFFADKIVSFLKNLNIKDGEWLDLGSGTGVLSEKIEKEFHNKNLCRIDFSNKMLLMDKSKNSKILWDLNKGLPPKLNNCSLIVSNFCLHWLTSPELVIKEWFEKLAKDGVLIVSYPTNISFPEWRSTCSKNKLSYSGNSFPSEELLLSNFSKKEIYLSQKYKYKENFPTVYKLLKNIVNLGAQTTSNKRNTVYELRKLQKYWPKKKDKSVELTWEVNILILKK